MKRRSKNKVGKFLEKADDTMNIFSLIGFVFKCIFRVLKHIFD